MPPLEEVGLNDKAVLWVRKRYDRYNKPVVMPPVEIDVKWEEGQTPQFLDPQSRPIVYDAIVQCNQEVRSGSILWLGELADWPGSTNNQDEKLMMVSDRQNLRDDKGRVNLYILKLKRFGDTLPTVEA